MDNNFQITPTIVKVYHPNCSQWSSIAGPSVRIHSDVASRTVVVNVCGPHPITSTRWFDGTPSTPALIRAATSGRRYVMEKSSLGSAASRGETGDSTRVESPVFSMFVVSVGRGMTSLETGAFSGSDVVDVLREEDSDAVESSLVRVSGAGGLVM